MTIVKRMFCVVISITYRIYWSGYWVVCRQVWWYRVAHGL